MQLQSQSIQTHFPIKSTLQCCNNSIIKHCNVAYREMTTGITILVIGLLLVGNSWLPWYRHRLMMWIPLCGGSLCVVVVFSVFLLLCFLFVLLLLLWVYFWVMCEDWFFVFILFFIFGLYLASLWNQFFIVNFYVLEFSEWLEKNRNEVYFNE